MIKLKKIAAGLAGIVAIVGVITIVQQYTRTYAANTITASNQVITIGGTTDGLPPNATTGTNGYSADENVIVFRSNATNLPNAGGPGGLYTYNIKTNTISRIDVSTSGVAANSGVILEEAKVSETGRYVLFMTLATNLQDGSTQPSNNYSTYKRDTLTGTTTLIDTELYSTSGNQNRNLAISNDGKFVLMASRYIVNGYPYHYGIDYGTNNGTSYSWLILVKDGSLEGDDTYYSMDRTAGVSCDGSFAVYQNGYTIEIADFRNGTVTKTTIANAGGVGGSAAPVISCDGRYVLYVTANRTDITPTPSGMNTNPHLVRYDRITGERIYVDSNSSGVFSTGVAVNSQYSVANTGDVVFSYNGYEYLKHLSDGSGTLESIGKTTSGANANVLYGRISSDGRYIMMMVDPYTLGLAPSPSSLQYVRVKSGI